MPNKVKLYCYRVPGSFFTDLVGTEKSQIQNTLSYYRYNRGQKMVAVPKDYEINEISKLEIRCAFPVLSPKHFFNAEVREGITFNINVNAFDYIRDLSENYQKLKRGDLYKFVAGLPEFGLYFLPEYIMEGLKEYDWDQHLDLVNDWQRKLEEILSAQEKKDKRNLN